MVLKTDAHRIVDQSADEVEVGRHLVDVVGTDGDDTLRGTAADERFLPGLGDDQVYGGGGNDTLKVDYSAQGAAGYASDIFSDGADGQYTGSISSLNSYVSFEAISRVVLTETSGDDLVQVTPSGVADSLVVDGGAGTNALGILGESLTNDITVDHRHGGEFEFMGGGFRHFENFNIFLGSGDDQVRLGSGNDQIGGGTGDDVLSGGAGNDYLAGQAGADVLTGGAGSDTFGFISLTDFTVVGATPDRITDFSHAQGDKIDLSYVDATLTQPFKIIGSAPFDGLGTAYELRIDQTGAHNFTVEIDTNHDKIADLQFVVHADTLSASDIVA